MNMRHRQLVAAGAKLIVDGVEAAMPERPVKTYPDKYPFEIEINPAVSYGGEGLEQYRDQELTPPIILWNKLLQYLIETLKSQFRLCNIQ